MDIHKILNSVKTLNDYITATETIVNKCGDLKIQLNMSTVLNLKKVRSLEIEYFNKCEDNGAAFVVFERMLKQPPAKTWALLGKELLSMIQYWLDAVRKHLISHSPHWWTFLRSLLRFTKDLKSKDQTLLGIIVEQTTECLLDVACNGRLDELQRQEVLQTMNECCAESSRQLRCRMKDQLSSYFVKLGTILSSCGHLPTQVAILETLLRWLVGRSDPQARRTAANAWFPLRLYRSQAVEVFLERTWRDFYQDARDFLNVHNAAHPDRVASVVCKKLTVGSTALINGPQSRITWLDVNAATKSVTVIMDPRVLESFASTNYKSYETLTVTEDNLFSAQLHRENGETILSIHTLEPLKLQPSESLLDDSREVIASVGTKMLPNVDKALRIVFGNKYQISFDVNDVVSSPQATVVDSTIRKLSSSEEERCSNVVRRRKHSGYIVRSRNPLPWNSPSTASTTSLAQLHDKLVALPPIYYTKEPIKVCAQPELPVLREVSEHEERSFSLSNSSRSKHFGVCQSDSEIKTYSKKRNISPAAPKTDKPVSLMFMTTIGSADESVISDTLEKLNKTNAEFDLLDLLVKEAFQSGPERDSGIITDKKTPDSEVIENTPFEKQAPCKLVTKKRNAKNTVVNSTSDESNTEVVNETPNFVTVRKKRLNSTVVDKTIQEDPTTFDAEAIDAFFSQHFAENNEGRLVISPTLAKKINETSSENSEDPPNYIIDEDIDKNDLILEAEIIDCLNSIVDEVCNDLEKCAEILSREQEKNILEIQRNIDTVQNNIMKTDALKANKTVTSKDNTKKIKLKFQTSKKRAPKKNTKQRKDTEQKEANKTVMEEDNIFIENTSTSSPVHKPDTSLLRKKRKLYSPKDDDKNNDNIADDEETFKTGAKQCNANKTPIATCYKELEVARRLRSRKFRASTEPPVSPKTHKMNNMFDKLMESADNPEKIKLVKPSKKDLTVYNYTSESEDEDFKKKKMEVQKRVSSTSLDSTATKRGRLVSRINYSESINNSSADESNRRTKKRKVTRQNKSKGTKVKIEPSTDLIDERMRDNAAEVLENSFVKEAAAISVIPDLEPPSVKPAEMEIIPDEVGDTHVEVIEPVNMPQMETEVPQEKILNETAAEMEVMVGNINGERRDIVEPVKQLEKNKRTKTLQIKKEKGLNKKAMESEVISNDISEHTVVKPVNKLQRKKRIEILKIKKEKGTSEKEAPKKDISEPGSPLPGLVVETERPREDDMTASVEADMLQKFKKIYKEGPDINETDTTQNLVLRSEKCESPVSNRDIIELVDIVDNIDNILPRKDKGNDLTVMNHNENILESTEVTNAIDLESPSERSIPTVGKSPITGHNDLNELPPSVELLQEKFKGRDLELQDMSQSMMEFFVKLRNGLLENEKSKDIDCKSQTSPVLQPTKESSKELAMSLTSGVCTPKIVLTRMSSEEIEQYVSPTKSKSSSVRSPEVVLRRISSDEINKWLPMPCASYDLKKDKKYNKRQTTKKVIGNIKQTPKREVENKRKSVISPIKLSFDFIGKSRSVASSKENIDTLNSCKTRSQIRSLMSHKDEEIIEQPYRSNFKEAGTTLLKCSEAKEKNRNQYIADKVEPVDVHSVCTSESSRSIASVNEWLKKSILASTSSKADNVTLKDTLQKVMENLEVTLTEIHQSTGQKLAAMFLDSQQRLNSMHESMRELNKQTSSEIIAGVTELMAKKFAERDQRFQKMFEEFEKGQKERACEVIRDDVKQKTLMVTLLQEDVQATIDFIDKQNK